MQIFLIESLLNLFSRHMHSTLTRGTTPLDDLGYESGYK
jgi:hypothetical protein